MRAWLIGVALRSWPRPLRERHGRSLEATTRAAWAACADLAPGVRLWRRARLIADVMQSGLAERWMRRRGESAVRHASPFRAFAVSDREVVQAWRSLVRRPAFAVVVFITLTLGLAANITVFTIVNGVILRPLPYRDPGQLAFMWSKLAWIGVPRAWVAGPHIDRLRRESRSIESIVALRTTSDQLLGQGEPQLIRAGLTTPNLFDVLGVRPMLGRGFVPDDAPRNVVILSYDFWRRLGADPQIVGRRLTLSTGVMDVVGVLPAECRFLIHSSLGDPTAEDVWLPVDWKLSTMSDGQFGFAALVRVRPGQTLATAQAELDTIGAMVDRERFHSKGFGWQLVGVQDDLVGKARPALLLVAGAAGTLLLVVCANLAGMMFVRLGDRRREFALRAAIGAGRAEIVRLVLVEGAMLAVGSAMAGLGLADLAVRAIAASERLPVPRLAELHLDWHVVAFAVAVTVAISLAMGALPGFGTARDSLAGALAAGARGSSGRLGLGRRMAVGIEVAVATVLVVASGLLGRSYQSVLAVNPGFEPAHVLTATLRLNAQRYPKEEQAVAFHQALADRLTSLPRVRAVGATTSRPLSGDTDQVDAKPDGYLGPDGKGAIEADLIRSTPGYLAAMGIQLLSGRDFAWTDNAAAAGVALVDEAFARAVWPGQSPIGRIIQLDETRARVVGVVTQARQYRLEADDRPQIYRPYAQDTTLGATLAIRATGDPAAVAGSIRQVIAALDPTLPVARLETMPSIVDGARFGRRLQMQLLGGCAAVAIVLAALGIYGLLASLVAGRTREIGIRLALGATRAGVRRVVLTQTATLIAGGLAVGVGAATAASGVMAHFLFQVSPRDPVTLVATICVVVIVAGAAAYFPLRRALAVDPARALRAP
jgi:predicted permease